MNKLLNAKPSDWQRVNKLSKTNTEFKSFINNIAGVKDTYDAMIDQFELWRQGVFQVFSGDGTPIIGKPDEIFPCTYQEWTGRIPFDTYDEEGVGAYGPGLAMLATAFRRQVGNAYFAYRAASNINRAEYDPDARPGEGDNEGTVPVASPVQPVGGSGPGNPDV